MKAIITLLGFAAAWESEFTLEDVRKIDALPLFAKWANTFDRHYDNLVAESTHFMTFLDNLYIIAEVNSQDLSYKLALNQFSDMNSDEFRHYVHGDGGSCFRAEERQNLFIVGTNENEAAQLSDTPDSVDWTTKGVVTPVKNQGQCGSCWAFSTTGSIECDYAIRSGTLNSLSEQQLVDCAGWSYGCQGCNGGAMMGAMKYVADNGGLCSESEYSYTARGGTCKSSSCGTKYNAIRGGEEVHEYSSAALETATAAGCVSVAIEADQLAFQFYSRGVLTGTCGTNLDHGVLVVGYGTSGLQQYWKVKNSWGPSWGESGYVLICRNCDKNGKDGQCGILMQPSIPTF